jgi:AcrR family transcriptional regulator
MDGSLPAKTRKPRTDSVRNRERLLEAAKAVFSAGGTDVGLEAVAKQAAVGIGTLYRHFPTREALFEAVYRREVEQLAALAQSLAAASSPVDALREWMHANIEFVATKKGMSSALAVAVKSSSDLTVYSVGRLTEALCLLLRRAIDAGEIRDDIGPADLLRTIIGLCYIHEQPGWQENVLRLLDVFLDGMRLAQPKQPTSSASRPRA